MSLDRRAVGRIRRVGFLAPGQRLRHAGDVPGLAPLPLILPFQCAREALFLLRRDCAAGLRPGEFSVARLANGGADRGPRGRPFPGLSVGFAPFGKEG